MKVVEKSLKLVDDNYINFTEDAVAALNKIAADKGREENLQSKIKDNTCPICIDTPEKPCFSTCCYSVFCLDDILQHLKSSNNCPMCRANMYYEGRLWCDDIYASSWKEERSKNKESITVEEYFDEVLPSYRIGEKREDDIQCWIVYDSSTKDIFKTIFFSIHYEYFADNVGEDNINFMSIQDLADILDSNRLVNVITRNNIGIITLITQYNSQIIKDLLEVPGFSDLDTTSIYALEVI